MSTAPTTTSPRRCRSIRRCLRGLTSTVCAALPLSAQSPLTTTLRSLPERLLGPPPPSLRHHPGPLPWRDLPLPRVIMGTACIPPRTSSRLRDPNRRHGGPPRAACRSARPGLPSVPCGLVDFLGCMRQYLSAKKHTELIHVARNPPFSTSSQSCKACSPRSRPSSPASKDRLRRRARHPLLLRYRLSHPASRRDQRAGFSLPLRKTRGLRHHHRSRHRQPCPSSRPLRRRRCKMAHRYLLRHPKSAGPGATMRRRQIGNRCSRSSRREQGLHATRRRLHCRRKPTLHQSHYGRRLPMPGTNTCLRITLNTKALRRRLDFRRDHPNPRSTLDGRQPSTSRRTTARLPPGNKPRPPYISNPNPNPNPEPNNHLPPISWTTTSASPFPPHPPFLRRQFPQTPRKTSSSTSSRKPSTPTVKRPAPKTPPPSKASTLSAPPCSTQPQPSKPSPPS